MREIPTLVRPVLALALAAPVLVAPRHARADSFVEFAGGISIPVGDDDWSDLVESSPKLALKVGSIPNNLGGMLSVDWTPVNTDIQDTSGPFASTDYSASRFRILANVVFEAPFKDKVTAEGRAGIGIDIAHASAEGTVLGQTFSASDTDVGLGIEFGGAVWFNVGSLQVGPQIAFPIGLHDDANDPNDNDDIGFEYTSYDFDLMIGVRLLSK